MRKIMLMALALGLASVTAVAAEVEVSDCLIQEVLPGKHMTGAFVTFNNHGEEAVELQSAAVPSLSEHVELHEMVHENGVMSMREIPGYTLPHGETQFKKGGYHVMIMDIKNAPEVGSTHEMTFHFADGSDVSCAADVKSVDDVMTHFALEDKGGVHKHVETTTTVTQVEGEQPMQHHGDMQHSDMQHDGEHAKHEHSGQ